MRVFRRFWHTAPVPADGQDMLEFLGATRHALPHGAWVYALHRGDGSVLRVGQVGDDSVGNLISRLRDHIYAFPEFAYYSLLRPRDEHQADLYEAMLVDYYQPEANKAGTARVEELRRRIARSKGGSGLRGYKEASG